MTPIQPRLAESNLFLMSVWNPVSLPLNEFNPNPLFNRDRIAFQGSGLWVKTTRGVEGSCRVFTRGPPSAWATPTLRQMGGERIPTRRMTSSTHFYNSSSLPRQAFKGNIGTEITREEI
jgi:hypothetical protein